MKEYGFLQIRTPEETGEYHDRMDHPEAQTKPVVDQLACSLEKRFESYQHARREMEEVWLKALRNVKGEYSDDQLAQMKKNRSVSEVFVRLTATKVNAATSRIIDMLFTMIDGFWDVLPSSSFEMDEAGKAQVQAMAVSSLHEEIRDYIGVITPELVDGVKNELHARYQRMLAQLEQKQLDEATEAALAMKGEIKNYLAESEALVGFKAAVREIVTLGTGCYKVATLMIKNADNWSRDESGQWSLQAKPRIVPEQKAVSVFDIFPNPWSREPGEIEDLFHRHVLSRQDFLSLADTPGFDGKKIHEICALQAEGNHVELHYENRMRGLNEDSRHTFVTPRMYDVLEYWGEIDGMQLADHGIENVGPGQMYSANIWTCGGQVIFARLNPLRPNAIPYRLVPYDRLISRMWGIGIPEMMFDTQEVMNAAVRAMLDNASLNAGNIYLVDVSQLPNGQSAENYREMYPNKVVFYDSTKSVSGKPMVSTLNKQSNQVEMINVFELFRRFADEETSLPSYTHGEQTDTLNKTASGMSMLMSAANISLKSVIKNIDDYLIIPAIQANFNFAMQWSDNEKAKRSDHRIVAMGSTSLMSREIRSNRLMQAMQVSSANPVLTRITNWYYLLNEYYKSLDIDPEKATVEEQEAVHVTEELTGPVAGRVVNPASPGGRPPVPGVDQPPPATGGALYPKTGAL